MTEQATLTAQVRERTGTVAARRLRRDGKVPIIIYGQGLETLHLWVTHLDLHRGLSTGNLVFSLDVDGKSYMTVVKEVQMDLYHENILHADFQKIDADEEIEVTIPLDVHGTPRGEKEGGRLIHTVREVGVRCLPADIPERVVLEVGELDVGDSMNISQVTWPKGVVPLADPDLMLVILQAAQVAPEEEEEAGEPAAEGEMKEPEVIGKDKKDEEEE
jgi:large subunit ribosomal protein L25